MGTPQVFPLIWNGQGAEADRPGPGVVWNPKAPSPVPLKAVTNQQSDDIVKDQANPGKTPIETELDKIAQHNDVAANTLCQKNRKRKQSSLELPFDPTVEEGTVYTLQGFAENFDGNWLVTEVDFSFAGKSGSRMTLELMQCLAPPQKTAGGGAGAPGSISVPSKPTEISKLVYDGGINSIPPKPANVQNLTKEGDETAPTWLNNYGSLNKDQQDLQTDNTGPAG
jgi:hypothetical protein